MEEIRYGAKCLCCGTFVHNNVLIYVHVLFPVILLNPLCEGFRISGLPQGNETHIILLMSTTRFAFWNYHELSNLDLGGAIRILLHICPITSFI